MPTISRLGQAVAPFHVMELLKAAEGFTRSGGDVIHLSIGEPDFPMPATVQRALVQAIDKGQTRYTHALGIAPLREAVAQFYASQFGVQVQAEQVVITSGSSAALQYACLALLNPGDEVLLPDPCYPCNKAFIQAAGGQAVTVPTQANRQFEPDWPSMQAAWTAHTKGLMLATPANPTGTQISQSTLLELAQGVKSNNGFLLVDEIYQMLSHLDAPRSAMQVLGAPTEANGLVIVNSFSKYFGLTGLRLGWVVLPLAWVPVVEKLAQNLAICPNTPAQWAALACFQADTLAECEARRLAFGKRRAFLMDALPQVGLPVDYTPDSAFYFYLPSPEPSAQFCQRVLEQTQVCLVPGLDFSAHAPQARFRLSYANSLERLEQAIDRLAALRLG